MIVQRITWVAKRGQRDKLVQIGTAEDAEMNYPNRVRNLIPAFGGSWDTLITEFEFEDIDEYQEFWAEWRATRGDAFMAKMNPLAESLSVEIFEVVQ